MSDPKVGTGKKPKGSGRRLYTDENPKDTVSVEFSSAAAIKRTLAKASFKSKSHKRQSQIINLIHQRARAAYQNAKDPKVKARLKRAFEYAKERKEASKRKTKRMQKAKNESIVMQIILEELESVLDEKKKKKKKKKRKKAGTESGKESSLRDWFGRKGAPGKKGGWVDCNTCRKDKKTGRTKCKPCGRTKGEKRSKYPSCRPTPGACKERGRGKTWGKKSAKKKKVKEAAKDYVYGVKNPGRVANIYNVETIKQLILEGLQKRLFKPGLMHHVEEGIPLTHCIYRVGSPCYFNVIRQGRHFYKHGLYEVLNEEERDLFENTDLGEFVMFEGKRTPLDFPMYIEDLQEKKKKKKDPPVGKPSRNTGSGKKYKVFVRNPKTGRIKKITYGDSKGGLEGNWNSAEARKSFASRHKCAEKKDRTKAGYWACRAHKDFGKNVPGRFW